MSACNIASSWSSSSSSSTLALIEEVAGAAGAAGAGSLSNEDMKSLLGLEAAVFLCSSPPPSSDGNEVRGFSSKSLVLGISVGVGPNSSPSSSRSRARKSPCPDPPVGALKSSKSSSCYPPFPCRCVVVEA